LAQGTAVVRRVEVTSVVVSVENVAVAPLLAVIAAVVLSRSFCLFCSCCCRCCCCGLLFLFFVLVCLLLFVVVVCCCPPHARGRCAWEVFVGASRRGGVCRCSRRCLRRRLSLREARLRRPLSPSLCAFGARPLPGSAVPLAKEVGSLWCARAPKKPD